MAIKKKAILTDNTTLPTPPTVIPTITPTPPLFTNVIALSFGLAYKLPTQNVRNIPVLPDSMPTRPSQNVGFDISITDLTQPKPMYLNDINGIFNLYSGTLADICSGLVPQFDLRYIQIRQQLNLLPPPPSPTPTPTPLIAGYPAGAILFSPINLAWYLSLQNDNQDSSINSLTPTSTAWQKISDISSNLVQHGRLSGVTGKPYNDTLPAGNSTLYFTPTEKGNLISLYNGNNWVTQSFNEVSLDVSSLDASPNAVTGSLSGLNNPTVSTQSQPSGIAISPDGNFVYCVNNNAAYNSISQYTRITTGTNAGQLQALSNPILSGKNPIRIIVSPDGNNVYVTNNDINTNIITLYTRNSDGTLSPISAQPTQQTGLQPLGIAISPNITGISNVYVVNNFNGTGGNTISLYTRTTSNGRLSPISSQISQQTGFSPTEIIVSPDGNNVYCTNNFNGSGGNSVSQYTRNSDGTLTSISYVATGVNPRGIAISPDGNHVYVANQTDYTVWQYTRGGSGILSKSGSFSTGKSPNQIIVSPDGLNVYVTNSIDARGGDSTISQYSRDLVTGQLTSITPDVGTGTNPQVIIISPNGKNVYCTNSNVASISQYSRLLPTAPTVALTIPRSRTNVSVTTTITITFSEAVQGVSLNTIIFNTSSGGAQIASNITVSGNSYTIAYPIPLTGSIPYYVNVLSGISSVATRLAVASTQFTFTTVNTNRPTVYISSPTSNVDINNPLITLQFSEGVRGVTPTSTPSSTGTVRFSISGQSAQNITITKNSDSLYTLGVITPLLNGTQYSITITDSSITGLISGNTVVGITLNLTTVPLSATQYDIFVGNNGVNVLTLAKDVFSNGTTSNRAQLPSPNNNGKWVNAHTIIVSQTNPSLNIQSYQGLLVGSITVSGGKVQSWNGYRGIWNLYNQVALGLLAYQTSGLTTPYKWQSNNTNFNIQNGNNVAGLGSFFFLIDLLYNQDFTCEYNGGGYFTAVGDNGTVGIALNPTTTLTPLVTFTYGGLSGSAGIVPFNLSYGYQFNNVSTTQLPIGLNWLQKVESGVGYFSDNIGLTAIYYG